MQIRNGAELRVKENIDVIMEKKNETIERFGRKKYSSPRDTDLDRDKKVDVEIMCKIKIMDISYRLLRKEMQIRKGAKVKTIKHLVEAAKEEKQEMKAKRGKEGRKIRQKKRRSKYRMCWDRK